MCGRYFLHSNADKLAKLFGEMTMPLLEPRYNIAPTQPVPIVRQDHNGRREMVLVRWGLIPAWSKGPDSRFSMINARVETVAQKPAYRNAFRYRRCLLPADGFYEWRSAGGKKQPFVLRPSDGRSLALAGLWEHWQDADGNEIQSCALLTTEAQGAMRELHQRMPVYIAPQDYAAWLDCHADRTDQADQLIMHTAPDYEYYAVGSAVGNSRNEGPELIAPVT